MIPTDAGADAEPPKLFRKNILEDINYINFDEELGEAPLTLPPAAEVPAEEPENALIDVIDVALDFAEDMLKDAGYPALKRNIWEDRGKKAMNKALNHYIPADSPAGGALDTPLVALLIGVGTLGICLYPVIAYAIKQKQEKEAEELRAEIAAREPERRTEPEAELVETDAPDETKQPEPTDIAAILLKNHTQFKQK